MRAVRPDEGAEDTDSAEPLTRHRAVGLGRLPSGFSTVRDLVSFIVGLGIICNEVFLSAVVEPYALGVGIALMGLPLVLSADDRKTGR